MSQAAVGASGAISRRVPGTTGSEQFAMRVPNNKIGLVIEKGGETIKNIQATSGARVQVIPLHPPSGYISGERTVQIKGSIEQIEIAKQMVNEVIEYPVGSWHCKECGNINWPSKAKCHMRLCRADKPVNVAIIGAAADADDESDKTKSEIKDENGIGEASGAGEADDESDKTKSERMDMID